MAPKKGSHELVQTRSSPAIPKDELVSKRIKFTPQVELTIWRTLDISRNFYVTGYSPESGEWELSLFPPEPYDQKLTAVKNDGPLVTAHIQQLVREVAAKKPPSHFHHPKKAPGIAGMHPPNKEYSGSAAITHNKPPTTASATYYYGLPPRAPPKYSKIFLKTTRDPLLHSSIITPPCPILPEDEQTPMLVRNYSHRPDVPAYLVPMVGMSFPKWEKAQ